MSPKRIGHTYKYDLTALGESVLLAGLRLHVEDGGQPLETIPNASQPVVNEYATRLNRLTRSS